jgi:integrase
VRRDGDGKFEKTTKNEASIRDIPLAPVLIALGLEQFVRNRAKLDRLFIEFRFGSAGRKSDGATKFWLRYLKKFGLWKPGRSTHVWRHTVAAFLRSNGVSDEDIGAFIGHSGKTVTSGYGGPQPLARKALTLSKLNYGFDILDVLGGTFVKTKHL